MHVNGVAIASFVRAAVRPTPRSQSDPALGRRHPPDGRRAAREPSRTSAGRSRVDDLARVERLSLFEIYNGHPQVNNAGGGGVPGLEEMWDQPADRRPAALRRGRGRRASFQAARRSGGVGTRAGLGLRPRRGARAAHDLRGARSRRLLRVDRGRADRIRRRPDAHRAQGASRPPGASTGCSSSAAAAGCWPRSPTAARATPIKGDEGYVRVKVLESNGHDGVDPASVRRPSRGPNPESAVPRPDPSVRSPTDECHCTSLHLSSQCPS